VVAAKPFADLDAKWAPTELASNNFVRVVYHSIAGQPARKPLLKRLLRRN
jgi:cyclase